MNLQYGLKFKRAILRQSIFALSLMVVSGKEAFTQTDRQDRQLLPVREHGKYGYINQEGKIVIQPKFYWSWHFQEGRALVYICGKYGFTDEGGTLAVPARFDATGMFFRNGLASVEIGKRWGYVNAGGELVISPRFDRAMDFRRMDWPQWKSRVSGGTSTSAVHL